MKARLHRLKTGTISKLMLEVPEALHAAFQKLVEKGAPMGDWYDVTITTPKRKRSTGPDSQNSHAWGHCQQIANETGNELSEVEQAVKERAIKRGYSTKIVGGQMIPISQAQASVEDLVHLIEEYHQVAAELGIILKED